MGSGAEPAARVPPLCRCPHRLGVPCAADVLSNAAFALAGVAVVACRAKVPHPSSPGLPGVQWAAVMLTGAGLLLTAAGSSVYHWHPTTWGW